MKMSPVVILAKYYPSARSAVSERPNLNARLVSQCPNLSTRLVCEYSVLKSRQALSKVGHSAHGGAKRAPLYLGKY